MINPYKRIRELKAELIELSGKRVKEAEEYYELQYKKDASAEKVIEDVLRRGISWYDYQGLPKDKQLAYYGDAQDIVNNETFKNEKKHFISDLVQEIAKGSQDFEQVMSLRMTINGVEAFTERLEGIINPQKPINIKTPEEELLDKHSAI